MSPWIVYALLGYSALSLAAAFFITRPLAAQKSAIVGILPALVGAVLSYAATLVGIIAYGFGKGLVFLLVTQPAPLCAFVTYAVLRARRHRKLTSAYKAQKNAERPAIITTVKMRRALKGFSVKSHIPVESQHEIVILLKNKTDPETIKKFYNCRESDLRAIERAFDLYVEKNSPAPSGEDYEVLPEQREFLLRLMLTATPSGLGIGEGLLWNEASMTALIRKASGKTPSRDSIHRFLDGAGILLNGEHYAFSETPEGQLWEKTQYQKIRLSALEKGASLVWIYALRAKALPYTALIAVNPDTPTLYGIYKENSGLGDFLNKLGSGKLYAVLTFPRSHFKKFTTPPPNITLFTHGERSDIPDT